MREERGNQRGLSVSPEPSCGWTLKSLWTKLMSNPMLVSESVGGLKAIPFTTGVSRMGDQGVQEIPPLLLIQRTVSQDKSVLSFSFDGVARVAHG